MTRTGDVFPRNFGDDDRARLTALFAAASAPAEDGPQPGEAAALAAFREFVAEPAGVVSLGARRMRRRAAVAATMTSLAVFSGGIAAAATGSLPDAAQQVAKDMFGAVGVHVPGASQHPAHPAHPTTPASPTATGVPTATDLPGAAEPTAPAHPAFPTTPPTPGNSGAARQHGVPTPSTHPSPGHGKPTAKPSPAPEAHPTTPTRPTPSRSAVAKAHRHAQTRTPAAVTHRFRPSISN